MLDAWTVHHVKTEQSLKVHELLYVEGFLVFLYVIITYPKCII